MKNFITGEINRKPESENIDERDVITISNKSENEINIYKNNSKSITLSFKTISIAQF